MRRVHLQLLCLVAWTVLAQNSYAQANAKSLDSKHQLSVGQFAALTLNQCAPLIKALGYRNEFAATYDDSTKKIQVVVFGGESKAEQAKQNLEQLWGSISTFHMADSANEFGVALKEEDYTLHYLLINTYDKENPVRPIIRKEDGKFVLE